MREKISFLLSFLFLLFSFLSLKTATAQVLPSETLENEIQQSRVQVWNSVLQGEAYLQALSSPIGQVFLVDSNVGFGSNTSAVRLQSEELQLSGFQILEFSLPSGLTVPTEQPEVLLVYRNFSIDASPYTVDGNSSLDSPILGLQLYSASNASVLDLPQPLNISTPSSSPIKIAFSPLTPFTSTSSPTCAHFNSVGSPVTTSVVTLLQNGSANGTVECNTETLGDFGIILPLAPPPSPPSTATPPPVPPATAPPPSGTPPPTGGGGGSSIVPPTGALSPPESGGGGDDNTVAIAVGVGVGGGVLLLCLLAIGCVWLARKRKRDRLAKLQTETERGVALDTALVGGSRAPTAGALRTRAVMESE